MATSELEISPYCPQFLWKLWLSGSHDRIHVYDVFENELSELRRIPKQTRGIFQDFNVDSLDGSMKSTLRAAEEAFAALESLAEVALTDLLSNISSRDSDHRNNTRIQMDQQSLSALRKFFVFLRFRNSNEYKKIVASTFPDTDSDASAHRRALTCRIRRRLVLGDICSFLQHSSTSVLRKSSSFEGAVHQFCWRFCQAELCIGITSGDQEFMMTETCFGTLDEGFKEDPECCHIFFPIMPTMAIYVLADDDNMPVHSEAQLPELVWIDCGSEAPIDVHLRNAMTLQTYPRHLYFSSLPSVAQSVSSYDEFRWISEHLDYSRLKQRCRQKYMQETVTKTLVVKGSVILTDLTETIVRLGDSAVEHGSFSDVWKGIWTDPIDNTPRTVALKFLRKVMVQNVQEKLMKRMQDEVIAWHRLSHRNIIVLLGIFRASSTIAMVSPWCENGTVVRYLKNNPTADRLNLLVQVASGVSYLHGFKPVVVHGDLKGANILVDGQGTAIITDFGLSKVIEDMSEGSVNPATSFFAGSTRWMAPELVLSLVEDEGHTPPITTFSDVYAFASVCLEIATGQIPYPHRSNDHAVIVDILRGVKPTRGTPCYIHDLYQEDFWDMLDRCWDQDSCLRPSMSVMKAFLERIAQTC